MTDEDKKPKESEDPSVTPSLVDEARAIRDDLVKAKEELKAENDRKEKLKAEELLSPSAGGAIEKKEKTEEEVWADNAKERYAGTGMDPTPDDTPTELK